MTGSTTGSAPPFGGGGCWFKSGPVSLKPLRLFRYCGNKSKLLHLYRPIPFGVRRIAEPFLGSGAFMLNSGLPGIGYEMNPRLVAMWRWLKQASADDLRSLADLVDCCKKDRPSVRDFGLDPGPETYVCVNVTGLVVGQLSSWTVYPQHSLPIEDTIQCLPRLKDIEVMQGDGHQFVAERGDMLFVDPPYIATSANYAKLEYDPIKTVNMIEASDCPTILTYGSNAESVFPQYQWETIKTVKVPNMRRGGTVDRNEMVTYLRMPAARSMPSFVRLPTSERSDPILPFG